MEKIYACVPNMTALYYSNYFPVLLKFMRVRVGIKAEPFAATISRKMSTWTSRSQLLNKKTRTSNPIWEQSENILIE